MHKQARLPEIFDKILQNIPVLQFGSRTPPPPPNWNLGRSWHFEYFDFPDPPPTPQIEI